MSYNITRWKTKTINNLRIPEVALREVSEDLVRLAVVINDSVLFTFLDSKIKAQMMTDGGYLISEINISGEGSGFFFHEILRSALSKSTGSLIATLIWEGGDSISRITVNDGEIKEEQVDL